MDKDANVESILQRIKDAKGFGEWKQVAQFLGINEKTLSAQRKRNTKSAVLQILHKCRDEFLEKYLLTGEGEPFPDPTHQAVDRWLERENRTPSELSEHEREIAMERFVQKYKNRLGDEQPSKKLDERSINELLTDTQVVLESETVYRQALASNIRAFKQAVINEEKMKNTDDKIDQMMKQIEALTAVVLQGQSSSTDEKKRAGNDH